MSEPVNEAETPPPEDSAGTAQEPVVNLDDDSRPPDETAATGTEHGAAETVDAAKESPQPDSKLEDADPEADAAEDEAAQVDRARGMRRMNLMPGERTRPSEADTINHVTGDRARVFQADNITYLGGEVSAIPRHGPVPRAVLTKLVEFHVSAPCEVRLLNALKISPVQCLVGSPESGRTVAAIAVAVQYLQYLRDQGEDIQVDGNVHILATDRGLAAVDASAIPEKKALILALPPDAPAPDVAWFGPIGETLQNRTSILIVVSAAEPVGPAALRAGWTVDYTPPESEEVFRCHLRHRLSDDRVTGLLSVPAVNDGVRRCGSPRAAARLAAEVITDLDNGVPDSDLLSGEPTALLGIAEKELSERELWHRIFLLATTVMVDLTAGTVTREAMRLAGLHKPNAVQSEVPKVEWFTGPPQQWSECVELVGDRAGDGSGQIVRLTHPKLAIPLLKVIWQDHVGERDVLLTWLRSLGAHAQKRVRVKAAQAAAQLACYDFDVLVREVIQAWARDGGFRTRQTAAMALEALTVAAEGRFARRVHSLVQGWARGSNIQLLATTVATYGTFLGAKDPDEALARMREIVGSRVRRWDGKRDRSIDRVERELANIVQRALLDVFAAGAQEKVIQALAGWARLPHWRWRKAAARSLLDLARRKGSGQWPLLVELASAQDRTYADVLVLWRNALDAGHREEAGWEALHRWYERANELRSDPDAVAMVALIDRLLADIRAANADMAKNLDFHKLIWAFRDARRPSQSPKEPAP